MQPIHSHPDPSLYYEVSRTAGPGAGLAWMVEAIDRRSRSQTYTATFAGENAEGRAREYAEWKNTCGGANWSNQSRG
jgi:hypothetical protein